MAIQIFSDNGRVTVFDTSTSLKKSWMADRLEPQIQGNDFMFFHVEQGIVLQGPYTDFTLMGVDVPSDINEFLDIINDVFLPSGPISPALSSGDYDDGTFNETAWDTIDVVTGVAIPTNARQATIIVNGDATGTVEILGFWRIRSSDPPLGEAGLPVYEGQQIFLQTANQVANFRIRGNEASKTHTLRVHFWTD